MATRTGYHCSPRPDLADALKIGDRTLCVADDASVARMYLRGGLDATHYLYTLEWSGDASAAGEAELIAVWKRVTGRKEYDESQLAIWDVAKNPMVRAALLADGYDAIVYGDSHEGCDCETTEFLRPPASLRIAGRETIRWEEATNG